MLSIYNAFQRLNIGKLLFTPMQRLCGGYARAARSLFRLNAFRVASGFRTVSYEAIGVISGITPPADVMAMELTRS